MVTVSTVITLGIAVPETVLANSFTGIGDLPGGDFQSTATAVSGDGSVVVGYSSNSATGFEAFRWTEAEGIVGLGDLPGGEFRSFADGVSEDGSVVVGRGDNGLGFSGEESFRWTQEVGMVGLGSLHLSDEIIISSGAYGVSSDGSIISRHYSHHLWQQSISLDSSGWDD